VLFAFQPDKKSVFRKAISFKTDDYAVAQLVNMRLQDNIPENFEANLNIPVCDDKLCAPVFLNVKWDLAGNYLGFDTIPGHPLTKFDHKRFSKADYVRLQQILKDKNSILRVLGKNNLVDKSVQLKATTVDAVTGATPATIKNAVIEGAVYSCYTLWHFVNGSLADSLRAFALKNYSEQIAFKLLASSNFETQLVAIKQLTNQQYIQHLNKLLNVLQQSSPIVRAYLINKFPIPFQDKTLNKQLVQTIVTLDNYSKSVFIDRVIVSKELAQEVGSLILSQISAFDEKQQEKFIREVQKLGLPELNQQIKEYFTSLN
jgi:hypothetical protein